MNNGTGQGKGIMDYLNTETIIHAVVIALVIVIAYHFLFHTA